MPPMPTRWWLRPVSSAARVGEQTAVTWNRLNVRACLLHSGQVRRPDAATEGVGTTEARVVDEHDQHVRRAFGRLRPVRRSTSRPPSRPSCDRSCRRRSVIGDRQRGAVGIELAHRLGQTLLQVVEAGAVHRRLIRPTSAGDPASACSAARRSSALMIVMMVAVPGFSARRRGSPSRPGPLDAGRTCRPRHPLLRRRRPWRASAVRQARRERRPHRPIPCPCGRGGRRSG